MMEEDVIEIERQDAVFRMDKHGRWINEDGLITKPSIIRYLNASIARDEKGYYLTHMLGNRREKVYFEYEDTALFAIDLKIKNDSWSVILNTRRMMNLDPSRLFIKHDSLYLEQEGHVIKFSERAAVKLAPFLRESSTGLAIEFNDSLHPIPQKS